jgi:hypothetical protein
MRLRAHTMLRPGPLPPNCQEAGRATQTEQGRRGGFRSRGVAKREELPRIAGLGGKYRGSVDLRQRRDLRSCGRSCVAKRHHRRWHNRRLLLGWQHFSLVYSEKRSDHVFRRVRCNGHADHGHQFIWSGQRYISRRRAQAAAQSRKRVTRRAGIVRSALPKPPDSAEQGEAHTAEHRHPRGRFGRGADARRVEHGDGQDLQVAGGIEEAAPRLYLLCRSDGTTSRWGSHLSPR